MQVVEQARLQVLANGRYAATHAHVTAPGGLACPVQRLVNSARDEMEHGAAFHRDRRAGMVREHESGYVIRRLLAPPAFPAFIGPGTANGPEHVSPQDPGAHVFETGVGHAAIDAGLATFLTLHLAPRARREK